MIIKSLSRTSGGAGRLMGYMFHQEKLKHQLSYQTRDGELSSLSIRHLIKGKTVEDWIHEFEENQSKRKYKRKGMIMLYHEIISFAAKDSDVIDRKTLTDITRQYIRLRSPEAPVVSTFHFDAEHVHIHLALAGSKYKTGLANRISKSEFAEIKRQMEDYQREKYPELSNSLVDHGRSKRSKLEAEFQLEKRTRKQSKREDIRDKLETIFSDVSSLEELWGALDEANMPHYSRGGKVYGVTVDNRNYRFSTLGFKDKMESLELEQEELENIDSLRSVPEKAQDNSISERFTYLNNQEEKGEDVIPDMVPDLEEESDEINEESVNPELSEENLTNPSSGRINQRKKKSANGLNSRDMEEER